MECGRTGEPSETLNDVYFKFNSSNYIGIRHRSVHIVQCYKISYTALKLSIYCLIRSWYKKKQDFCDQVDCIALFSVIWHTYLGGRLDLIGSIPASEVQSSGRLYTPATNGGGSEIGPVV